MRHGPIDQSDKLDALLTRRTDQDVNHLLEYGADIQFNMLECEPPGLEVGSIEEIVDDGNQRAARVSNNFGALALFGIEGARGAVVWIDRVLQLPTKIEILDGARDMIERHRFRDVRLNPGLADAVFTL